MEAGASLRESIQIDELWALNPEGPQWTAAARALATLPPRRTVTKNNNRFRPNPAEWNVTAAVGQCVGEEAAAPCEPCRTRRTHPFTGGCVVLTPEQERHAWVAGGGVAVDFKKPRCCFNCRYQWQYSKCKWAEVEPELAAEVEAGDAEAGDAEDEGEEGGGR